MAEALAQFDRYRRSPDRWMLGRFVVSASRLDELGKAITAGGMALDPADPWRLSVVIGAAVADDLTLLASFQSAWNSRGVVADSIEVKVASPDDVLVVNEGIPAHLRRHFEVPRGGPYCDVVRAIGSVGAFAKVRTGGTTPELFPAAADVASFLAAAVAEGVPFKATAGLHHPFRGPFPITYEAGAERQVMHGFVNVLVATAALLRGEPVALAEAILAEGDRSAFRVTLAAIAWRDETFSAAELASAHQRFFLGFGSCSFREPHDELDLERAG